LLKSKRDKLLFMSLIPFSISLLSMLLLLISISLFNSIESLSAYGLSLFAKTVWDPENGVYGVLGPILGTLITSLISVSVSLVFSLSFAITIAEYLKGYSKKIISSIAEFMGGLPTIIYAVWASEYLVPFLKNNIMEPLHALLPFIPLFSCRPITGFSTFVAGVALGISTVPYVASIILEAYENIPLTYREACYGIGATKYEAIKILLSLTKPAIIAALILGFARSLGETTIVAFTVGNSMTLTPCLFAPGYTVSALVASQFANAFLYHHAESVLYASMLVTTLISIILSLYASKLIIDWRSRVVA
jgi:phosphate transport system permease protein